MGQLWEVLGVMCVDAKFTDELLSDARGALREFGFRLSRYEFSELALMLNDDDFVSLFRKIQLYWEPDCNDSLTYSSTYQIKTRPGGFRKPTTTKNKPKKKPPKAKGKHY